MLMDKRSEFCDATAAYAAAGTALVGNVIDLGRADERPNENDELQLVIQVDTLFAGTSGFKVQFELASDAQAAIATDGSATAHMLTAVFGVADLAAGATYVYPVPKSPAYERYLGILSITSVQTSTAGKINAFLTRDKGAAWRAFSAPSQA